MELSFDPDEAIVALARSDRVLGRIIKQAGPFTHRPEKMESPFQSLLRTIVHQQLNGKAAATILRRVHELHPDQKKLNAEIILATTEERLRSAGLSPGRYWR